MAQHSSTDTRSLLPDLLRQALSREALDRSHWFVGIDLGTTNSSAALVDGLALLHGDLSSAVRLIPIRQETEHGALESPLLPSIVAAIEPGGCMVGAGAKEARRRGLRRGRQLFYSIKSEMGLGREPAYPSAAFAGLNCPYKVASKILTVLRDAIVAEVGTSALEHLVVTVPASFQLGARRDTFRAAQMAGLKLVESALLDEPNSAFLDYLLTEARLRDPDSHLDFSSPKVALVFDFGGGTCDVSVLRLQADERSERLTVSNLAISRYECLGGDNINAAIVEQVLIPQLLHPNRLNPLDFSWTEKKNCLMPQLLDIAETLKVGVCAEYSAQLGLRSKHGIDRARIVATQPSEKIETPSRAGVRTLILEDPALSLEQFERTLAPFLDRDLLFTRGTELNPITSIFAPLKDVLDRAALHPTDVDAVLLAGGSSLIPQVEHALATLLSESTILKFSSPERSLYAVARGAALHSFFLYGLGKPLFKPIAQETVGVLTQAGGFVPLIPAGTELPYPADGSFNSYRGLSVPHNLVHELDMVLAADHEKKVLAVARLRPQTLPEPGEPIELRWRLDANKILEVKAALSNHPETSCEIILDNPLCSTGYESEHHQRILEIEQDVAQALAGSSPLSALTNQLETLADLYYEERKYERAIDWARKALQARNGPDVWMLNLIGSAYLSLAAFDRAESMYREAIAAEPGCSSPYFNLALALERMRHFEEALVTVEKAIQLQPDEGAYAVERAQLLRKLGRDVDSQRAYKHGAQLLGQTRSLSDFQLDWRIVVAQQLGDDKTVRELEKRRRRRGQHLPPYSVQNLPAAAAAIVVRQS